MPSDSSIPFAKNNAFIKSVIEKNIAPKKTVLDYLKAEHDNAMAVLEYLCSKIPSRKKELCKAWSNSVGFAHVDLDKTFYQKEAVQLLSRPYCRDNLLIPLYKMGDHLTVAMANPSDNNTLRKTELSAKCPISPIFALPSDIVDAIEVQYQDMSFLDELINNSELVSLSDSETITKETIERLSGETSVVSFVRGLLLLSVKENASDIHIEPGEFSTRIRYRIDGVLQARFTIEKDLANPIVSRLKILADRDITEKRRPQDGRISLELPNRSIDFRFSSVPTIYGEKLVMRLLGSSQLKDVPSLEDMGFSKNILSRLNVLVNTPNGVFFVTGPTGSGKTTTLYSAISSINKPDINIMTIEDPVEYRLAGINQIQVNSKIGLDFASALRSFLRQDPDVILVGEIRDAETAKIASQAALTGHLVFATMHTNNALQAVTRLVEIGVEPFLVAPSIIGVLSQRLVRKLCDNCKERYQLSAEEIDEYFIWDGETPVFFWKPTGCEACNNTGYSGRIAIHELFLMDDAIRMLVANNASILEIEKAAMENGFKTMRHDGLKKVLRGLTTIAEVDRVIVAKSL